MHSMIGLKGDVAKRMIRSGASTRAAFSDAGWLFFAKHANVLFGVIARNGSAAYRATGKLQGMIETIAVLHWTAPKLF